MRLAAIGKRPKLKFPKLSGRATRKPAPTRATFFSATRARPLSCPIYQRERSRRRSAHRGTRADRRTWLDDRAVRRRQLHGRAVGRTLIEVGGAKSSKRAKKAAKTKPAKKALDPVTLEVIRNALPAIANEMSVDLQRTSYNMMIYEVRDYCTALLDTEGQLISQNVGGVSHFVADLGVDHHRRHEALRRGRLRAGRRDHHQPSGGRRPAPQQHRHLHALLPSRASCWCSRSCARTGSTSAA